MLLIPCPWCGPREEIEFRYAREANVKAPAEADDRRWSRYLYFRANPVGEYTERWVHVHGCRRWFNVVRHTITHEITGARPLATRPGEPR